MAELVVSKDATARFLMAAGAHGAIRFDLHAFYDIDDDCCYSGGCRDYD